MNIAIPKQLRKQIVQRARRHGMTEGKYVQEVLQHAVSGEETVEKELQQWRSKARLASLSFWQKHNL